MIVAKEELQILTGHFFLSRSHIEVRKKSLLCVKTGSKGSLFFLPLPPASPQSNIDPLPSLEERKPLSFFHQLLSHERSDEDKMALLHRFLRLNDGKETCIFTFIVTRFLLFFFFFIFDVPL